MKFIFLISGMSSWENALPIIYKISQQKNNKIIIGVETYILFKKFLQDKFRISFLKNNKIKILYLNKPRSLKDFIKLLLFYLKLSSTKFSFIFETIDFDKDLKLTNIFLKFNLFLGCKRIKIFSDSLSENELKNTQIFYDVMKIENKKLDFSKYDLSIFSNEKNVLKNVYKNIKFSKYNINLGKIKLNKEWLEYIYNYYSKYNHLKDFDILIPLSATKGKFLRNYEATVQEKKLKLIFEVLSELDDIKVVFKPHSKSDMDYFKSLIENYNFKYLISDFHLVYLCSKSKLVLTYHPTSAQIYAKHFKKNVIEFGEYDEHIENILDGKARYFESVDRRIKFDKDILKDSINYYIENITNINNFNNLKEDTLGDIVKIIKNFNK